MLKLDTSAMNTLFFLLLTSIVIFCLGLGRQISHPRIRCSQLTETGCLLRERSSNVLLEVKSANLSLLSSLVAKSCPTLATPWTVAHQAPMSMGFSRQEYWSGLPFPSPGDFPDPGIELGLLHYRQILYRLSYDGSPKNF